MTTFIPKALYVFEVNKKKNTLGGKTTERLVTSKYFFPVYDLSWLAIFGIKGEVPATSPLV